MTLKIKLGKAEHDALDESLKSLYVADGENFKLDADYEDVDGLKAKRDELLGTVSKMTKTLKAFENIDPEKAKEALTKLGELEDGQLLKKQQFDELFAKKKGEWEAEKAGLLEKIGGMTKKQAEKDLTVRLMEAGARPDLAEDLATVLTTRHIKYVEDGGDVVWKTSDGLETVDLDKYIPGLKESKADYFKPTGTSGSGATGSQGNGGGSSQQWTRQQWDGASTQERTAFTEAGGTIT